MIVIYIALSIIFSVCLLFLLYILATMCRSGHSGVSALRGWAYAHRGLHGKGVPENSIEAFRLAAEAGYGSELDVHLMADGNLAVIHDSVLMRTTGAEGNIEDLTEKELGNYHLEGTDQVIPTFEQVLAIYAARAPLIVELKPTGKNHADLCRRVSDVLDHYQGMYCIESFDPRCVRWFRKNRPDVIRGQLSENFLLSKTSKLPWAIKCVMMAQMTNFMTRPDFVAYRYEHRKNFSNVICRNIWKAQGITWTVQNRHEFEIATAENWIPIFEGFRP